MKVKYLFSAVIAFFLGVALAPPESAAEVGGYFGVTAGQTDADFGVSDFDDGSITSGSVDDTDTGTKLFGGYRFTENAAIEGGIVDLGEITFNGISNGFGVLYFAGPVAFDIEADGLFVAGVFGRTFDKGAVFVKIGYMMWDAELTLVDSGGPLSADDDGTDLMFGFGGEYRVNDRIAIRAEFETFTEILEEDISLLSLGIVIRPKPSPRVRTTPLSWPESKPVEIETPMPKVAPAPSMPEQPKPALPEATAAARGDADAQYRLGYMYSTGQGVPKDDANAVRWYSKAAGQGHARAQYNLGAAYANGIGVIRNKETAAEWFFEAGQSFVSEDKQALALRVVDTIERLIPGHALASELLAAIRARFGF